MLAGRPANRGGYAWRRHPGRAGPLSTSILVSPPAQTTPVPRAEMAPALRVADVQTSGWRLRSTATLASDPMNAGSAGGRLGEEILGFEVSGPSRSSAAAVIMISTSTDGSPIPVAPAAPSLPPQAFTSSLIRRLTLLSKSHLYVDGGRRSPSSAPHACTRLPLFLEVFVSVVPPQRLHRGDLSALARSTTAWPPASGR